MIAVYALVIVSEKIGFDHSNTCIKLFLYCFCFHFLCKWRFFQIFIEKCYPADGWLFCDIVSFQNAKQGIVFI